MWQEVEKKGFRTQAVAYGCFFGRGNVLFCCWQLQKQLSNYCLGTHFVTFSAAFWATLSLPSVSVMTKL